MDYEINSLKDKNVGEVVDLYGYPDLIEFETNTTESYYKFFTTLHIS